MAHFEDSLPYHAWGSRYLSLQSPHMSGTDVKVFQTLFNAFVQHSTPPSGPIGPTVATDGVFGPNTDHAVRHWQSYFHLSVDGVIGPGTGETFGQLASAYGGPRFGSRALRRGESGGDVRVLQNRLDCLEYGQYFGSADGVFGPATETAVHHFQSSVNMLGIDPGVPVDGIVGPETGDALWAYTYVGGRDLYQGTNGIDTLWVQRFLLSRGEYSGALDGLFDLVTHAAVEAFQHSVGISADGVVGPVTMKHIGQVFSQPASSWP